MFLKSLLLISAFFLGLTGYATPVMSKGEAERMIMVAEGEFLMGMKDDDPLGLVWTTPQRRVDLMAFYIDKHEVTNKDYRQFIKATQHRLPYDKRYDTIYNWSNGKFSVNLDDHPVVLVDWHDADSYCRWVGKRLPTESEWEKAARGTDWRKWPWRGEFDRFMANTVEFGVKMTMPVGSFPKGVSFYGVMDMAGNVFEWTSGWYRGYPGTKYEHPDYGEKYRVIRGGAWTSAANPYAFTFSRSSQLPSYKHRSLGFRCAKSVGSAE